MTRKPITAEIAETATKARLLSALESLKRARSLAVTDMINAGFGNQKCQETMARRGESELFERYAALIDEGWIIRSALKFRFYVS